MPSTWTRVAPRLTMIAISDCWKLVCVAESDARKETMMSRTGRLKLYMVRVRLVLRRCARVRSSRGSRSITPPGSRLPTSYSTSPRPVT